MLDREEERRELLEKIEDYIQRKQYKELRALLLPLEAADIAAATVLVGPPDVTLELDAGEIETLADLLADVRITRPDQSYSEYAGQTVLFTVTMADGTAANVTAYNPFLIIDGTGWRTAYAPCEALNRFANELLRERGG